MKIKFNLILQLFMSALLFMSFIFFTNGFESVLQINSFEYVDSPQLQHSEILKSFYFQKTVNMEKDIIFNSIFDVNNYSKIFPDKILHVEIIDENDFSKSSFMTFNVFGMQLVTQIQHETIDDSTQIITVLDGPSKNSKIILNFSELGSNTKIDANIFLKFKKPLSLLAINMNENDFQAIFNKVIESFVNYTKT